MARSSAAAWSSRHLRLRQRRVYVLALTTPCCAAALALHDERAPHTILLCRAFFQKQRRGICARATGKEKEQKKNAVDDARTYAGWASDINKFMNILRKRTHTAGRTARGLAATRAGYLPFAAHRWGRYRGIHGAARAFYAPKRAQDAARRRSVLLVDPQLTSRVPSTAAIMLQRDGGLAHEEHWASVPTTCAPLHAHSASAHATACARELGRDARGARDTGCAQRARSRQPHAPQRLATSACARTASLSVDNDNLNAKSVSL